MGIIGGIVVVVGTVLPWFTFTSPSATVLGINSAIGLAVLVFGGLGLVLVFLGRWGPFLTLGLGLLIAILTGIAYFSPALLASLGVQGSVAYGLWVSLAGGIVLILAGWVARRQARRAAMAKAQAQSMP